MSILHVTLIAATAGAGAGGGGVNCDDVCSRSQHGTSSHGHAPFSHRNQVSVSIKCQAIFS